MIRSIVDWFRRRYLRRMAPKGWSFHYILYAGDSRFTYELQRRPLTHGDREARAAGEAALHELETELARYHDRLRRRAPRRIEAAPMRPCEYCGGVSGPIPAGSLGEFLCPACGGAGEVPDFKFQRMPDQMPPTRAHTDAALQLHAASQAWLRSLPVWEKTLEGITERIRWAERDIRECESYGGYGSSYYANRLTSARDRLAELQKEAARLVASDRQTVPTDIVAGEIDADDGAVRLGGFDE